MNDEEQTKLQLMDELLQLRQRVHALEAQNLDQQQVTAALQDAETRYQAAIAELQRQNLRSQLFTEVTLKIRRSLELKDILQTTVAEVQKFLQADRVVIFRLWPDGAGRVVEETVVPGWPVILGRDIIDPCFQEGYISQYRRGRVSAIQDVTQANIDPCHLNLLQSLAVRANLVVPILLKEADLWGLLIAHQCGRAREWTYFETDLLRHLADQIGIALAQAQLLEREVQQRQELARSNAELQDFAYVASHDLQEPLGKIQAFGDRLKATDGTLLSELGRDYLDRMQNAARRMQALINDLLTLSRITTQGRPFMPTDLRHILQEVLSDLEVRLRETSAQVEVGELPVVEADPVQMRQLLQNLLSNALKFRRADVPLRIGVTAQPLRTSETPSSTTPTPEVYEIAISDNGIGFEEKYLDRIFTPFQRLHGRSEYEGTGIGLGICRKIVERHQGEITARSCPGEGSTFLVTLPRKQQGVPPE